jgi:hypothetical protein
VLGTGSLQNFENLLCVGRVETCQIQTSIRRSCADVVLGLPEAGESNAIRRHSSTAELKR